MVIIVGTRIFTKATKSSQPEQIPYSPPFNVASVSVLSTTESVQSRRRVKMIFESE